MHSLRNILLLTLAFAAMASAVTYNIQYTAYSDNTCTTLNSALTSRLYLDYCAPEYAQKYSNHSAGKITFINEDYLTSCDYSDTSCNDVIVCVNYTNAACSDTFNSFFSDKYSWVALNDSSSDDESSSSSSSEDTSPYRITYTAYTDVKCTTGDEDTSQSGRLIEGKCADEYRSTRQAGKITFVNEDYLTSCDYADDACSTLIVCVNYTRSVCYASTTDPFSNQYTWDIDVNGTATIMYTSYTDTNCTAAAANTAQSGLIPFNTCGKEFHGAHQSGMITFVNDDYLTSCDYADTNCTFQIVCVNYTNAGCYVSGPTTSNKYTWYYKDGSTIFTPSSGSPSSGAPSSGAPSSGNGAPSSGTPSSGTPSSGDGGSPSSGTPSSGDSSAPSSGTPSSGTSSNSTSNSTATTTPAASTAAAATTAAASGTTAAASANPGSTTAKSSAGNSNGQSSDASNPSGSTTETSGATAAFASALTVLAALALIA
jgi:hypothetical protein